MINKLIEKIKKDRINGGDITFFSLITIILVFRIFNIPRRLTYEIYDIIVFFVLTIYFISNYAICKFVYKEKNTTFLLVIGILFALRLITVLM